MRNSVGNSDRLGNSRVMVAHRPVSAIETCTDGVCCRRRFAAEERRIAEARGARENRADSWRTRS